MDRKTKPDLYDLLRTNFGNETVESEKLPEPEQRAGRAQGAKAKYPSRVKADRKEPVTVRKADPKAWKLAREAVDGDTSRLEILGDGSVVIHNRPMR